jgi:hypothetical protein
MSGRSQEFREFARDRAWPLQQSAYLLCGDWYTAQDVVQETLIKGRLRAGPRRRLAAGTRSRAPVGVRASDGAGVCARLLLPGLDSKRD